MKTVLFIPSKLNYFTNKLYSAAIKHPDLEVIATFLDFRPQKSLKSKVFKNLKQGRGGYVIIMILEKLWSMLSKKSELIEPHINGSLNGSVSKIELQKQIIDNLKLLDVEVDVILLIGGFGIIEKEVLDFPKFGVLSFHHGDMRKIRGMPPVFWEIYNNESHVGITFQKLSAKLDAGVPLAECKVEISNKSYDTIKKECYDVSIPLFNKSITRLRCSGKSAFGSALSELGSIYTLPNLAQWLKFHIKNFLRTKRR